MSAVNFNPVSNYQNTTAPPAAAQNQNQNTQNTATTPPSDQVSVSGNTPAARQPDWSRIREILAEGNRQTELFREMIERLLNQQANASQGIISGDVFRTHHGRLGEFFAGLEVDDATQAWAAEMVGEDGYFGVAQTSERILGFARAFAGNDLERLELMQNAFLQGFAAAERAWGGTLPSISQQTFDAVMNGFSEWRNSITAPAEENGTVSDALGA